MPTHLQSFRSINRSSEWLITLSINMIVTTIISIVSTSFVTLTGNDHESVF